MNDDQKRVAIGAVSGALGMILVIGGLYYTLPNISGMESLLDRLVFTLRLQAVAVLPLLIMIGAVGNGRFLSKAIDPLRHAESTAMEVNSRVLDNTLQQYLIFLVGTLALSTFLNSETIKLIPALVVNFILARCTFWVGYRIHPLYRACGMAATLYMNIGILLSVLYFFLF